MEAKESDKLAHQEQTEKGYHSQETEQNQLHKQEIRVTKGTDSTHHSMQENLWLRGKENESHASNAVDLESITTEELRSLVATNQQLQGQLSKYREVLKDLDSREKKISEKERKLVQEQQDFELLKKAKLADFSLQFQQLSAGKQLVHQQKQLLTQEQRKVKYRLDKTTVNSSYKTELEALKARIMTEQVENETKVKKLKSRLTVKHSTIRELNVKMRELNATLQDTESKRKAAYENQFKIAKLLEVSVQEYAVLQADHIHLKKTFDELQTEQQALLAAAGSTGKSGRKEGLQIEIGHKSQPSSMSHGLPKNAQKGRSRQAKLINKLLSDGRVVSIYPDGTEKTTYRDGRIVINYFNGDVKQFEPRTGETQYFYAGEKMMLTTKRDGSQVWKPMSPPPSAAQSHCH